MTEIDFQIDLKFGNEIKIHFQIWYWDERGDGTLIEQTKDFNKPWKVQEPFKLKFGKETLVTSFFSSHVSSMTPNTTKDVTTTCDQIYGPFGHPILGLSPSLPINIRIYLVDIEKTEDMIIVTDDTKYESALKYKEEGNAFFGKQLFQEAKKSYLNGISYYVDILDSHFASRNNEPKVVALLIQLFNNLAQCDLKLKNYNSAMDNCRTVMYIGDDQAKTKAHYRYGVSLEELNKEILNLKGKSADRDWLLKEAKYHFKESLFYGNTDLICQKKIQNIDKILSAPKGFAGMFNRDSDTRNLVDKF